jgi:small-conductance mechanosensitive channel
MNQILDWMRAIPWIEAPLILGAALVLAAVVDALVGLLPRLTAKTHIRSTRILTRDDIQIIIPNAAIANAKIVNETGGPHDMERVRVDIGVAYGSDIDQVRQVLLEVASASEHLVADPAPRVRFRRFGDSSLDLQLLGWIDEPVLRGRALDELNTAIYKRFMAEGIQIPFPQRDVHLHTV